MKTKPTKREMINQLISWSNSCNYLNSKDLSSVGIDDLGDLRDQVPEISEWMGRFYNLVNDWKD